MNMKIKKLVSWVCAICAASSVVPITSGIQDFQTVVQAADSSSSSNEVKFTAIGQYTQVTLSNTTETPTWYSSNTNVATVDSTGKITAVGEGTCTIYAVFTSQVLSINVTVEVPDEETDITVGSLELSSSKPSAKVTLSVDTTGAVWSSSDESVATVTQDGTITAAGVGSCTVIASLNGKNYIINVTSTYDPSTQTTTVTEVQVGSIELTNTNSSGTITLNGVTDGTVIEWSSSDESVATVDQNGTVTAVGSGECKIIALIDGVKYIVNVTSTYTPEVVPYISAESTEIDKIGGTLQLELANNTTDAQPEWISTNENVATVDDNGVVTAVGEGTVVIIATLGGVPYQITITVNSGVLYGDANCDGEVTIADAVLVMSYVGNSSAYEITEQGLANADVYGDNDGLSNQDALSIQKYVSGTLTELPES